ncbi:hypothetical protein IQ07DRAFT_592467 [Pyrenochaeta sp. DS3sAY3a]|nr:hypothetical protein IQ07DRAFT_592467 [Pyrenochaeta sp. DS3sAY3a]
MSSSIEIITTPTADTPGTTLVLRTANKHYVFGSLAEGTQRAMVQQGTKLLKAQDFFLTGTSEWRNTGGLIGMMLTLADSSSSSYEQAMEMYREAQKRGRTTGGPQRPKFNIYGPPNLKHMLGTCRRFIFRKGIPIIATEYASRLAEKDASGAPLPTWKDGNISVWALSVKPKDQEHSAQAEAALEERRRYFDSHLNTFEDLQAPENESPEAREERYDQIRTATVKFMFDSNWSFDTLVERHISEVEMPAAIFVRNPNTNGYQQYRGPKPGGPDPLPDITVFTRTPWPGAKILALPPTRPTSECVSYIVRTHPARGQFDVARAKALGVKPGPDFGKLTNGQSVQNKDGEWIAPEQVLGADRPGQGVALLDIPTADYIQSIIEREELTSPHVMTGIGAIVWILGPGVSGHPVLNDFMASLKDVQHVVSSIDSCPNRIAYDSAAVQATSLGQVDPARYSTPVHDSQTVPQRSLYSVSLDKAPSLPKDTIVAERGTTFILMPKFATKTAFSTALFEPQAVQEKTAPEVLALAAKAQQAVQDEQNKMLAWKQLLARPDTEVITLGTGSALPSKYRNVSATLVRVPDIGNYLFDAGENTLGQLSRMFPLEELEDVLKNLRVIWISHLHADHHLGTASVIKAWYKIVHGGVPKSQPLEPSATEIDEAAHGLAVISHSGMLQWLNEYSSIEDFGYSRILPLEITPNAERQSSTLSVLNSFGVQETNSSSIDRQDYIRLFGFSDIQAAKVAHCNGAVAVSITFPRSPLDSGSVKPLKVSYSGDCRPSYHFGKVGTDTTVLIHEATFDDELQGDAKAKKHSTTSEALGVGAHMDAKAVVLTHFSQRYQKIPVLQTVTDGEQEDPLLKTEEITEEVNEEDVEVDPTTQNADNMDIHPTVAKPATTSKHTPANPIPILQKQSSFHDNERIIKVRNKNMKVAIAFDYMRVKIGEIAQLEKFNEALNELLIKEKDEEAGDIGNEEMINANGKKLSGDEAGAGGKKQKKEKKDKSKRNN